MDSYDLYTLLRELREALSDCFPGRVWVRAEIASIQVRTNGHCYMDLVQSENGQQKAKVKAVIWGSRYPMIARFFRETTGSALEVGQQILVRAQVSFSELYGLSLSIDDINPEFTLGDAQARRQQTIDRLQAEGLIERQKQLSLPMLPYRFAVISAPDAAGYGDFCRQLLENRYGFRFEVSLFEAVMQGASAPSSIIAALSAATSGPESFDAVLIMRGGGSNLDLACFDDYELGAAIARSSVPVLCAIGHDRDFHVADMVSWDYVKTPTALADFFISVFISEDERISALSHRLHVAFSNKLLRMEGDLDRLYQRIVNADPRAVLSRGYTLAVDASGKVIKSAGDVKKGDRITVMLSDGSLEAVIV